MLSQAPPPMISVFTEGRRPKMRAPDQFFIRDALGDRTQGPIGLSSGNRSSLIQIDDFDMGPAWSIRKPAVMPGRTLVPFSWATRQVSVKAWARRP